MPDTTILMILPALLVLVGMLTGYCFWGWLRGVDQNTVDDLHDEIRGLGRQIERNKTETGDLQDLHFENQELRLQTEALTTAGQQNTMEIQELRSVLEVRSTELKMAEATIVNLRQRVAQLKAKQTKSISITRSDAIVSETPATPTLTLVKQATPQIVSAAASLVASNSISRPTILSMQPQAAQKPASDIEYGGEVSQDENLGMVYTRPPMFNDNLQLISGIASKLENQLNDYGVYTFQQIMLWSDHNIEQFSSLLDTFQDRIQRDDWVGQAEVFYKKARQIRNAA